MSDTLDNCDYINDLPLYVRPSNCRDFHFGIACENFVKYWDTYERCRPALYGLLTII